MGMDGAPPRMDAEVRSVGGSMGGSMGADAAGNIRCHAVMSSGCKVVAGLAGMPGRAKAALPIGGMLDSGLRNGVHGSCTVSAHPPCCGDECAHPPAGFVNQWGRYHGPRLPHGVWRRWHKARRSGAWHGLRQCPHCRLHGHCLHRGHHLPSRNRRWPREIEGRYGAGCSGDGDGDGDGTGYEPGQWRRVPQRTASRTQSPSYRFAPLTHRAATASSTLLPQQLRSSTVRTRGIAHARR